ncbi:MAG: dethiobiotin synthase [Magnetococcales bacterium]|nr:dethiobiotin synthase [Magnetococcales bacterium]
MERLASGCFVTGTDTGVGKSVAAAWLVRELDGDYWKPVQCGLEDGEGDGERVARLAGVAGERIHPERYRLNLPRSPHEAAAREGITIRLSDFVLPQSVRPLVVEGAGGVLVPLNDHDFMVDLMRHLGLPVALVARTALGTINHTLLSLEALRRRGVEVAGVILNGDPDVDNRAAICRYGQVEVLGEIPVLPFNI